MCPVITSLFCMIASECSQNHFISETYKEYSHLNYISFQIVPLCNYALLSEAIKVLENSWKPSGESFFSSSRTSLLMSVASQKCCPFNANFTGGTGKNQMEPGQESMGDAPMLSHCHEEETNFWFSIFWGHFLWLYLWGDGVNVHFFNLQ